ncbi:MAG: class I SAM-dependent methyltransferase [Pyrinomonadaceae bacterium]
MVAEYIGRKKLVYAGTINLAENNNPRTKIVKWVRPGSRVLEIGCATGFMSQFLTSSLKCKVAALELNERAAEIAKLDNIAVIIGDIEDANIRRNLAGEYDYLIFGDVLEHLTNPSEVLSDLVRYLCDDGHVLLSIPNVAHWSVRKQLIRGRFNYADEGLLDRNHLRFFTLESAIALIENCGLRLRRIEYVHSFPQILKIGARPKRFLTRLTPGLFAWQFVIDAMKTDDSASGSFDNHPEL